MTNEMAHEDVLSLAEAVYQIAKKLDLLDGGDLVVCPATGEDFCFGILRSPEITRRDVEHGLSAILSGLSLVAVDAFIA